MKILRNMFKFTDTNKDISNSEVYQCMSMAENGNYKEFKKMYKQLSKSSFSAEYLQVGMYRLQGYQFNFRPFLKRFLVCYKDENSYYVRYALNKTNLYDNFYVIKSRIYDIVEDTRHVINN